MKKQVLLKPNIDTVDWFLSLIHKLFYIIIMFFFHEQFISKIPQLMVKFTPQNLTIRYVSNETRKLQKRKNSLPLKALKFI